MGSRIIQYFLEKSIFVNLLTFLILLMGGYTAFTMNREAFPNINFDLVSISTIFPGASPSEVEKLITNPIEKAIKSVDGIKNYRSASIENRSGIVIQIDPDVKDTSKVVDDIRSAVDRVEDLPTEADDPLISEITTARQPVIEVNVYSLNDATGKPTLDEFALRAKAKILEDQLLLIPGVARITRKGWNDTEMQVYLDPNKLEYYRISSAQIIGALKNRNINFPGGNLAQGGRESIVRTVAEFDTPNEISDVFIRSNDAGQSISLRDLAYVKEGLKESEYLDRSNGTKAIALTVVKRKNADAIKVVDAVKKITAEFEKTYKSELKTNFVNDLSKFIKRRLGVLISNAVSGLLLVVISLFFFLGWRMALMTALGIPVSFALTFVILNSIGITLNLISMFGLIIVVGILVDDAIIICENVYRYIEMGMEPYEAVLKGASEVASPVTATVTTTIAAFAPMLFMTGIFGKFIFSIPLVVILALATSLAEAFVILPSHLYDISKGNSMKGEFKGESGWFYNFKKKIYLPTLSWCLQHKLFTILILFAAFFTSVMIQAKFGRFKLFPGAIETFQVKISAETGLNLSETEKFAKVLENSVLNLQKGELDNVVTRVGIIQKDPNDPFTKRGKNFAQLLVYLTPEDSRKRTTEEIINDVRSKTFWLLNEKALKVAKEKEKREEEALRKKGIKIPERGKEVTAPKEYANLAGRLVGLEFEKLAGGPPVGKPVAIEVKGDDFEVLKKIGEEYKQVLTKIKGVEDIGDDFTEGKNEIRVKIDESLASRTGVNVAQIAIAINTAYQGTIATKIKRADEEVEVRVRFPEEYRNSIQSLDKIFVTNNFGNLIPVSRMASYEKAPGKSAINHLDGRRLLTVGANIDETTTTSQKVNAELRKIAVGIIEKYPGYSMNFGGENKDTEDSLASLGRAFLVGLIIIFMILASLFRSFFQPLIVMSAIPFSIIGVFIAFVIHGEYLSFLSFLGVIGLAGVVVNDSIVLVDYANGLRDKDPQKSVYDILMETGDVRIRAVTLTTVTTVLGLLPTAYGIGGKDPFLVPMALAFGWGLMFASLITLLVVPVFYHLLFDAKMGLKKIFRKKTKSPSFEPIQQVIETKIENSKPEGKIKKK